MRLTARDEYLPEVVYAESDSYSIREKLAAYEDTGYEPYEIKSVMDDFKIRLEALSYLTLNPENMDAVRGICEQMLVSIKERGECV